MDVYSEKSLLITILFLTAIFFSCVIFLGILFEHDDFAALRASAYISSNPNHQLIKKVVYHLNIHKEALDSKVYGRYYARLTVYNNYKLQNALIRLFERAPMISIYQSAYLSILSIFFCSGNCSPNTPSKVSKFENFLLHISIFH